MPWSINDLGGYAQVLRISCSRRSTQSSLRRRFGRTSSKKQKRPPQVSGTGRFRFGGESSYYCGAGCGAICGAVSATDFESAATARGIAEEEVLTSRVRYRMNGVTANGIFSRSSRNHLTASRNAIKSLRSSSFRSTGNIPPSAIASVGLIKMPSSFTLSNLSPTPINVGAANVPAKSLP